jgi:hypothetical protein
MNRRELLRTVTGAAVLSAARPLLADTAGKFYFAVIADTHIIDEFYQGPEGNAEDTATIFKTTERLTAARATLAALRPSIERVFIAGDFFHNYPSTELDFFFQNKTRIDNAKALIDGFPMPVHVGFGNHDYAVPKVSREMSHELFRRKLGLAPYYAVEHKGYQFIHLNNFVGSTWKVGDAAYDRRKGSFGEQQLNWFEAQLATHKPAFVFLHYPLLEVVGFERADYGLYSLLKKYKPTIQLVVNGHWHRWAEFGRTFGPPSLTIASPRYDPNAYLIVEVDPRAATHRLLNIDLVDWNTHYSQPYRGL